MSIFKIIEVSALSNKSWEDAAQMAVADASRTLRNIHSVYIKDFLADVENGKIVGYRAVAKVTFEVEQP